VIDLASDSSDDDAGAGGGSGRAAQPPPEQPKRRRILQLPPAPASLARKLPAQQQQPQAFPAATSRGAAPRKPGDRSYLGAYCAADLAEGSFPGGRCSESPAAAGADASEQPRNDRDKGKRAMTEKEDDFGGAYGGEYYDAELAAPHGEWVGGGGGYGGGAQQKDWDDWGDPYGQAGPSYTSPQRR